MIYHAGSAVAFQRKATATPASPFFLHPLQLQSITDHWIAMKIC
ncbi:MAG: hypothetical protein V7K69_18305 [Nostoc sp.]